MYVYNGEAVCRQIIGFAQHEKYPCLTSEEFGPLRVVAFLPFNHIFGLIANLITMPFQNQSQIFLKDRAPQTILETARKCDAKVILTVPLLVNSISSTIKKRVSQQSAFKRGAFKVMQSISLTCQRINPLWGLKVGKKLFKSVNKNPDEHEYINVENAWDVRAAILIDEFSRNYEQYSIEEALRFEQKRGYFARFDIAKEMIKRFVDGK